METIKVTTWNQLKQLTTLAQEYSEEDKQYDAPFAVYAVELVRVWQQIHFAFYLLTEGTEAIGYFILHTDATGLTKTCHIYDIFITKDHRDKGGFAKYVDLLRELAEEHDIKRFQGPTVLSADQWAKHTGVEATEKHYVVVDNPYYKE